MARGVKGTFVTVALVAALASALPSPAAAQDILMPTGSCIGIVHFPDDPIGDAPSKMIVGVVLPPEYAGDAFTLDLSGASGNQMGTGTVGVDGLAFAEAPLYSYGPHQITSATVSNAVVTPIDTTAIGDGGSYVVDDNQPVCDETVLTPIPAETTTTTAATTTTTSTTTTSTTTTSTTAPETTTAAPATTPAPSTTAAPSTGGETGSFPWPAVLIGGGLILIIGGAAVALSGKKDCDREREHLARARRRLSEINETLQQALHDMEGHEDEIRDLTAELESMNKSKQRGSITDKGVKYYSHDGELVPDYELDAEIEYVQSLIEIAREAHSADEQRVKEWHEKFQAAESEVQKAEEALAICLGEGPEPASPTPAPPGQPGTTVPGGPQGPGIATAPPPDPPTSPGCEEGATYTRVGEPERLRPVVDFSVIVTVRPESKRKVEETDAITIGLGEAVTNLGIIGKALGAGGAVSSIKSGLGGLAAGKYVMGAGGLAKGTAEGAMASGITDISIPTSGKEALVEALRQTAKIGKLISTKIGQWLRMNQLYDVHLTQFVQMILATPHDNYRCVNGEWKCERIWEYSVGKLEKAGKPNVRTFRLESEIQQHRMQAHINMLGRRAQQAIAQSLKERAEFDARHQPGPCK